MKTGEETVTRKQREQMVRTQIEARGIHDPLVLEAMGKIPRHLFMPGDLKDMAYEDMPQPIGWNQTISQPYIVAYMTKCLGLAGNERVLEIGSGRGYQTAILSCIAARVYTVERLPELARKAQETFTNLGLTTIETRIGDGTLGWETHAPFDAILVTASGPRIPEPLTRQLALQGRLVMPVGTSRYDQQILRVTRIDDGTFTTEKLLRVAFVPLIGKYGWEK